MFFWVGIALDVAFVLVFILTIVYLTKRGFAASVLEISGRIISLILAGFISYPVANLLAEMFVAPTMTTAIQGTIEEQGINSVQQFLDANASVLPSSMREHMVEYANGEITMASSEIATVVVSTIVMPILTAIIALILFLILYFIFFIVVRAIARATEVINKIPVLKETNKFLGFILGIVGGLVQIILLMTILWFGAQILDIVYEPFSESIMEESYIYKFYVFINPFIQ